ncbi:hypothetical protein [Sphingopyxis panaciterrae]
MTDEPPYCAIYIDHRGPTETIEDLVAGLLGVRATYAGITTDQLNIVVDHGDSYPPIEERDYSRWINWKYRLEVVSTSDDADEATVAEPIKALLEKLNDAGIKAVPACDFEELLSPWNLTNAQN